MEFYNYYPILAKKLILGHLILFSRFPSYGNDMPYTPNYTFPNLTAPTGASDWPDYSGVDSTTNTPFEARQTPDLTSIGSSPMDTSQTGTYGIKVHTSRIQNLFLFSFHNSTNIFVLMWFDFNIFFHLVASDSLYFPMQVYIQQFTVLIIICVYWTQDLAAT